jgi:hypothetical protein
MYWIVCLLPWFFLGICTNLTVQFLKLPNNITEILALYFFDSLVEAKQTAVFCLLIAGRSYIKWCVVLDFRVWLLSICHLFTGNALAAHEHASTTYFFIYKALSLHSKTFIVLYSNN